MAKKYIDADRLIEYLENEADKEFKKTEENANSPVLCHFHNGGRMMALDTIDFINELQQEQPCEGYDEAYLNEKIAKASKTWEGVDVDKYMAEMRGYEQPSENLESEIKKYFQGLWPGMETAEQCNTDMHFTPPAIMRLAHHFYQLGKQSKEPVFEDLEAEIDRLWESFADEMEGPHNLFDIYARLARHFANWGAEHTKK